MPLIHVLLKLLISKSHLTFCEYQKQHIVAALCLVLATKATSLGFGKDNITWWV